MHTNIINFVEKWVPEVRQEIENKIYGRNAEEKSSIEKSETEQSSYTESEASSVEEIDYDPAL